MEKQVLLGSECDDILWKNMEHALNRLGAVLVKKESYVIGAQDIDIHYFYIGNTEIIFEIETYIGINIRGEENMVDLFRQTLDGLAGPTKG